MNTKLNIKQGNCISGGQKQRDTRDIDELKKMEVIFYI